MKGKNILEKVEKYPHFPEIPTELCIIINMLQVPNVYSKNKIKIKS
ncbi:MAG: hypothetical protein GX214_05075 [Clostridiales bacterium]|nr:hypothetical protein [Clostridiales bacterium]